MKETLQNYNIVPKEALESRTKDLDYILDTIIEETTSLLNADRGTIYVYDAVQNELWSKIAQGLEIDEIRLKVGEGIAGHVAKSKKLLNIKDAYNTKYFNPQIDKSTGYITKTLLVSPLLNKNNDIIGVIEALNKKEGVFTKKDEELIITLSSICAIAIEQAQLYQWNRVLTEYNENIIRNISSGLVVTDNGFKVSLTNRIAETLFKTFALNLKNQIVFESLNFFNIPKTFFSNLKAKGIAKIDKLEVQFKGLTMYFNIKGSKLQKDKGESYGYILLFDDITEKILLEIEKKQKEATTLIGKMASSMIHDIKNPLTIIRSYIQLLEKKTTSTKPIAQNKNYYKIINSEVDRMVSMADEVLSFVQGDYKLNITKCSIEDFIQDIKLHIEEILNEKNAKLYLDLQYKGNINIDKDKLTRLLYNLSSNANDAIDENGRLDLSIYKDKTHLKIKLQDNGVGIPKNMQKEVFKPFISYNKGKGVGLGMAIVKKIVDEHKGNIYLDSKVNEGTSITISIPFGLAIQK